MEIKDWVDENFTISLKTISSKCMQEFGVRIIPERMNTPDTIHSRLQYALRYINLSSRFSENEIVSINKVGFNWGHQLAYQFLQYDREIFQFVVLLADQEFFYMNRVFLHIILLVIHVFDLHLWSD
ncbi:hypothetical protein HZS_4659 [Henneguya salminicola]|nr:hypothetical protein HZS_4659 [Henneguya salminicola]